MTLEHLETKPGSYWVLVDTKAPPGRAARQAVRRHGPHVGETDAGSSTAARVAARERRRAATRPGRVHRRRRRRASPRSSTARQISRATSQVTNPLSDATGLTRIVPSSGWRIYTVADSMPSFDPRHLAAPHRRARPAADRAHLRVSCSRSQRPTQVSTFHCVTGWIVDNVHWGGVRFHDLLAPGGAAARRPGGCTSSPPRCPTTTTSTYARSQLRDVMLAYEMDGKPLPQEHGAPVRVVIPEMYGYKNVKWVERIELVARPARATGSSAATTSTPGSDARTATSASPRRSRARPRVRRALHAHRTAAPLGTRERLLRPTRLRASSSTSRPSRPQSRGGR